jgi:hypothetical protein
MRALALFVAGFIAGCSTPTGEAGGSCSPAPRSCDAPSPRMNSFDLTRGCLGDPIELSAVCNTSVNRCAPSAGLGPVCAVAPDGGVFVAVMSDNNMLTATGWRFDQGYSFPNPAAIPADQFATPDDTAACNRAWCAHPCPGVQPLAPSFLFCRDAGKGDAASGE